VNAQLKADVSGPLALMETVFDAGGQLAAEYPLIFRPGFDGRLVVLEDGDDVHSSCAVITRRVLLPGVELPIGLIGSVATKSTQRGRGHASQVLSAAERWLCERGAAIALLWAEDPRFYLARGYRPIGSEVDAVLDPTVVSALPCWGLVRAATPADAAAIHRLYSTHSSRVDRTADETAALLRCPRMQVLVAEEAGTPVAYACLGRGRDLENVVHEWAGGTAAALGLFKEAFARSGAQQVVVMAPDDGLAVIDALATAGAAVHRGFLGLAKVLPGVGPARLIAELLVARGGGQVDVELSSRDGLSRWRWAGPRGATLLDGAQVLDVLCGPRGVSETLAATRAATGLVATELPLKPFVWGLDSI